MDDRIIKGRGSQTHTNNKFDALEYEQHHIEGLDIPINTNTSTKFTKVYPKSVINHITSPDVGMEYSINPYHGCEHGCVYCYARNSHQYWGFNPGLDFESNILIKQNTKALVRKKISHPKWKAKTIVLSGNTDCYQPIEKKLKITRSLLELFYEYRHPVGIITKNSLILRDLDVLTKLNEHQLIQVNISITTLNEKLKNDLEPRTSSIKNRFKTITELSEKGIPVNVMIAPIIPGLNSHEIIAIAKKAHLAGATSIGHTIVRLNGAIATIFEDWISKHYPNKAEKVLHQIKSCHDGILSDSRFKKRMRGEGAIAASINQTVALAKKKYFPSQEKIELNTSLHTQYKSDQLSLF